MKQKKIILLAIVCLWLFLMQACKEQKKEAQDLDWNPLQRHTIMVDTAQVRKTLFYDELQANGRVRAREKYQISAEVNGLVAAIKVEPGTFVQTGDTLLVLKNKQLLMDMAMLREEMQQARIDMEDFLVGYNYSLKDTADISREIWEAACIQSGYRIIRIKIKKLQSQLEARFVLAPRSGQVANLTIKQGQYISANEKLCDISRLNEVVVEFLLLEDDYTMIQTGQEVDVRTLASRKDFKGQVSGINPEVDDNGLFKVYARIPNPNRELVEGMNVDVFIKFPLGEQLLVPKQAIINRNGESILFTYVKGKAIWNQVEVLHENSRFAAIKGDLKPADAVITKGNLSLSDQTPVSIRQSKEGL